MPASAMTIPDRLAKSGRVPPFFNGFALPSGALVSTLSAMVYFGRFIRWAGRAHLMLKDASAKLHNPLDHLFGRLPDAQDLTSGESDHGVRRNVDVLDQIRIQ